MPRRLKSTTLIAIFVSMIMTACSSPEISAFPINETVNPISASATTTSIITIESPTATIVPPTATPEPAVIPFYQFVPGGEFIMGSFATDTQAKPDELPEHTVTLPGFWVMTNEVTNEDYGKCVDSGSCTVPSALGDGQANHFGDPAFASHPVVSVTWKQADAFCKHQNARLPTEAEWEKAARGYYGNMYPWGIKEPDCSLANISGCLNDTMAVGSYSQGNSLFAVSDMAGNVREWVSDWYNEATYRSAKTFMPEGPAKGYNKVVRGSSYKDASQEIRSTARYALDPTKSYTDIGFRCVSDSAAYAPFCSVSYKSFCQPPSADEEPNECKSGQITGESGISSVSLSCQAKDSTGTVDVITSDPVSVVYTMVNGVDFECIRTDDQKYRCTGTMPANSSDVSVKVCIKYGVGFDTDKVNQPISCNTYNLVATIGDTVTYTNSSTNIPFASGLNLLPKQMNSSVCPQGYNWSSKLGTCVIDPHIQPKAAQGSEEKCPSNYIFDQNINCCLPKTTGNINCEAGYYLNDSGLCIPIYQNGCPIGFTNDPFRGCIQQPENKEDVVSVCPAGTHLADDNHTCIASNPGVVGELTCPNGSDYLPGQGCIPRAVRSPKGQCPENAYYDYTSNICVALTAKNCPAGTYFDDNNKECLPIAGPWTGCIANYMLNTRSGCCVPVPGKENSACLNGIKIGGDTTKQGTNTNQTSMLGQTGCSVPTGLVCGAAYHLSQDRSTCLPNQQCPQGTGPSPDNPFGCFPSGDESCPEGYAMSNSGLGCIPILLINSYSQECSSSQYFDPQIGACLDRTDDCCAQGFYFDKATSKCLPHAVDQNCPIGYFYDGNNCVSAIYNSSNCSNYEMTVPACPNKKCEAVICKVNNCVPGCCHMVRVPGLGYWYCAKNDRDN